MPRFSQGGRRVARHVDARCRDPRSRSLRAHRTWGATERSHSRTTDLRRLPRRQREDRDREHCSENAGEDHLLAVKGAAMSELNREQLRALLVAWRDGLKTARQVHEEAEALMEVHDWKDLPRSNPESIQYEVLCQLDILNQQLIIAGDIEAFLDFLAATEGTEEEAWARWDAYWNALDLNARREMLRGDAYYAV